MYDILLLQCIKIQIIIQIKCSCRGCNSWAEAQLLHPLHEQGKTRLLFALFILTYSVLLLCFLFVHYNTNDATYDDYSEGNEKE